MQTEWMLGDQLKKARKARDGMSRTELARRSGVPYSTIAEIENGEQRTSSRILDLAAALAVRPEWLTTGKGVMESGALVPGSQSVRPDMVKMADAVRLLGYTLDILGKDSDLIHSMPMLALAYEVVIGEDRAMAGAVMLNLTKKLSQAIRETTGADDAERGKTEGPSDTTGGIHSGRGRKT